MSDVQGEPLKGTALYNAILERFRAVPDAEGRLDCGELVARDREWVCRLDESQQFLTVIA